jgi:beta-glucosidase
LLWKHWRIDKSDPPLARRQRRTCESIETGRNIGNVILDKRVMRETDLLAFEIGVTEGEPGSVMCSYNKVNGDWACENSHLLAEGQRG